MGEGICANSVLDFGGILVFLGGKPPIVLMGEGVSYKSVRYPKHLLHIYNIYAMYLKITLFSKIRIL